MKRHLTVVLFWAAGACAASAAEPDWPAVEQHAVELLQQYLRVNTVNPPADTAEAELFQKELTAAGLAPKVYKSGPNGQTNLVVRLEGRDRTKKPLLLLNHFDVVPVDAKAWRLDPFGGIVKDGYIWGRGAMDMKGIGVMHLTALVTMKKLGVQPARDIVMLTTSDEETNGIYGIKWMIANHYDEIDCEYVLDEGGFGSRDTFADGKLVFGVSVGEKQVLWVRLRAKGTAGHGSQPIADSANDILLKAVGAALALPERGKTNAVVEELRAASGGVFAENKFIRAIQRNTASLTTLTSGVGSPVKINVIPSTAEATIDCRLLPGVNAEEFLSEMKARINDARVTVEVASQTSDVGVSRSDTPLFAAVKQAILQEHPGATVAPLLVPFGTDSVHLRARGVVAYGLAAMTLPASIVATMHSDEERIPVDEFRKGVRIFYRVLQSEF